jgi:GT2 family glycosyltransferase
LKDFSVIIPTRNSRLIAAICCALEDQIPDPKRAEIIVVGEDNQGLLKSDSYVRFVPTDQQMNAAVKRNIGMQMAKGKLFFFLDSDCMPASDWIEKHLAHHKCGIPIVGGAINFSKNKYLQLSDNVSAFHDLLPHTESGARPYLATANLSVNRKVVEEVGLLEEYLDRAHDLDWTVRMRAAGYVLFFEPQALIFHDPPRHDLTTVLRHWTEDAPDTLYVRQRHSKLLNTPQLAMYRWPFLWLSPAIAAWATARTVADKQTLFQYWQTLPMVYLTKLAWCWSAFKNFPPQPN